MSKVLLALYDIQDLGGIINWVEHLCHGIKANGSTPTLVRLENKKKCTSSICYREQTRGHSGLKFDQRGGWHFPITNRVPIQSTNWKAYTKDYDLLIWVVPVPSKVKLFDGWEELYDVSIPQVMVIHDGNLNKLYPHAYSVMDKCAVIAGVHDCAYNSIKHVRSDIIPNPQILEDPYPPVTSIKRSYVFSLQTFKRWKRVDDLVRAVPRIGAPVVLAGGGIEYYYMTSKGKRKPCYGQIWETAIESGMSYLGYIDEQKVKQWISKSKLLIDPSWSKDYADYGSHFNRTFVDAIIGGCLPAARDLLMDGNSFFGPKDYVTIPYNASSGEFGEIVNRALSLPKTEVERRIRNLRKSVTENFDSRLIAARYLQHAKRK